MKKVACHITLRGIPLCQIGVGQQIKLGQPMCGFRSLAEAHREKKKLQKLDWGFKVVRGFCPASAKENDEFI